eukprot:6488852-Amphidinium_carterae.1
MFCKQQLHLDSLKVLSRAKVPKAVFRVSAEVANHPARTQQDRLDLDSLLCFAKLCVSGTWVIK